MRRHRHRVSLLAAGDAPRRPRPHGRSAPPPALAPPTNGPASPRPRPLIGQRQRPRLRLAEPQRAGAAVDSRLGAARLCPLRQRRCRSPPSAPQHGSAAAAAVLQSCPGSTETEPRHDGSGAEDSSAGAGREGERHRHRKKHLRSHNPPPCAEWRNLARAVPLLATGAAREEKNVGQKVRGAPLGSGLEAKLRSHAREEVWVATGQLAISPRDEVCGLGTGQECWPEASISVEEGKGRRRFKGSYRAWPCSARGGKA
ncbi:uncharacterized protein LOC121111492 [Gallus gallus]|uniref:uncharacterized protein LOC121111492 n=1 Tax=Gallus gallus TaxID=9031 RepID=UPI001AEAA476|nr:uncharacterized protein LOC121111492 [Gallus gallus]